MKQIIYSVLLSHQAEVHNVWVYTDKAKAIAKMEDVKQSWGHDEVTIHTYGENGAMASCFGKQYETKIGYWYENDGEMGQNGLWEYGSVDLVECVLDCSED